MNLKRSCIGTTVWPIYWLSMMPLCLNSLMHQSAYIDIHGTQCLPDESIRKLFLWFPPVIEYWTVLPSSGSVAVNCITEDPGGASSRSGTSYEGCVNSGEQSLTSSTVTDTWKYEQGKLVNFCFGVPFALHYVYLINLKVIHLVYIPLAYFRT